MRVVLSLCILTRICTFPDVHRILERFAATIEANRLVRLKISTEEQKRVTLRSRQLQKMYVGTVRQIEGHHPDDAKSRLPSVGEFLRLPETLQAIQEPNEDQWRCFKGGLADFVLGQFRNEVIRMWSARARAAEMEDAGQDFPIDLSTLPPTGFESHKTTTLLATLRKAACVFYCHQCDTVHWVDTVVRHIVLIHNGSTAPLRMVSPGLVNRLLLDMGHMKGVVTVAEEYNMPILICTRCDSGVARYKTFEEMVCPFLCFQGYVAQLPPFRYFTFIKNMTGGGRPLTRRATIRRGRRTPVVLSTCFRRSEIPMAVTRRTGDPWEA